MNYSDQALMFRKFFFDKNLVFYFKIKTKVRTIRNGEQIDSEYWIDIFASDS